MRGAQAVQRGFIRVAAMSPGKKLLMAGWQNDFFSLIIPIIPIIKSNHTHTYTYTRLKYIVNSYRFHSIIHNLKYIMCMIKKLTFFRGVTLET